MNDLQYIWHNSIDVLGANGEKLSELLSRVEHSIFNDWPWLVANIEHLRLKGCKTCILIAQSSDERIHAVIPLYSERTSFGIFSIDSLRLIGAPLTDRVYWLQDFQHVKGLNWFFDALNTCPTHWDAVKLEELCIRENQIDQFKNSAKISGIQLQTELTTCAPVLSLKQLSHSKIIDNTSKAHQTRQKRARKKLQQAGNYEFKRILPSPNEVHDLITLIKGIEDKSWKGDQGVGIFSTPDREKLFTRFSLLLAEKKQLELSFIYLNSVPISYRFGYYYQQGFWDYNLAYLPDFHHLSPGRILLEDIITSSFDLGYDFVDSSRSSMTTPHLLSEWTDCTIEHFNIIMYNRHPKAAIFAFFRIVAIPIVKTLIKATLVRIRTLKVPKNHR